MVIDSVVAGNDAWHADELSEGRSGVLVYMVKMEDDEAAVVKIPSTYYRYEREVRWRALCHCLHVAFIHKAIVLQSSGSLHRELLTRRVRDSHDLLSLCCRKAIDCCRLSVVGAIRLVQKVPIGAVYSHVGSVAQDTEQHWACRRPISSWSRSWFRSSRA